MEPAPESSLERAHVLLRTDRVEDCLALCQRVLAAEPDNASAHALAASCHLRRGREGEALGAAARAVRAAPEWDHAHRVMAAVHARRDHLQGALASAREATRLGPAEPANHALLADLYADRREWGPALAACGDALALEPEHEYALVVRARALARSGRSAEALAAARHLLELNPESAAGHDALGWATLVAGDARAAEGHFAEALRLEPDDPSAREGLVEALKARRGLYRPLLAWKTLMDRFTAGEQMAVIVGLAVVVMAWPVLVMGALADYPLLLVLVEWTREKVPALGTIGGVFDAVLSKVYLTFMLLTWTGDPIFHLLLARERRLRLVLTRPQKLEAGIFAAVMLLAALGGALNGATLGAGMGLATFLALAAQIVPAPNAVGLRAGLPRALGVGLAVALLACALYGTLLPHAGSLDLGITSGRALDAALWGGILSSWALNLLSLLPRRRRDGA